MSNARTYLGDGIYVERSDDVDPDSHRGWDGAFIWIADPPPAIGRMGDKYRGERVNILDHIELSPKNMISLIEWWSRHVGQLPTPPCHECEGTGKKWIGADSERAYFRPCSRGCKPADVK